MSDLREAVAKAIAESGEFAVHDEQGSVLVFDVDRQLADVVLGVVHEHADMKAATKAWEGLYGSKGQVPMPNIHSVNYIIGAALGGSEKP